MSETFADRIKMLREKKGWSKAETARKLGVSGGAYSNWEYGNRKPDLQFTQEIANLFDVSTNYLLEGTYMLRDVHIMPQSVREKMIEQPMEDIGNRMRNTLGNDLSRKIKSIDISNMTVTERYFLDQAISFMINYSNTNEENILLTFGAFFRSLNDYREDLYDDGIPKEEKLEFYNEELSEAFSELSKEIEKLVNKENS